jgi:hypothetical protein
MEENGDVVLNGVFDGMGIDGMDREVRPPIPNV